MRKVKYKMYKNDITQLIKNVDSDLNVDNNELNEDLRVLGMDSIVFIRFLALIEDTFDIEFEYGFMDEHKIISVDVLNKIVMEKRAQ